MQIGLASKRTWCETEVAEKFTCPAACVERVWVPTDAAQVVFRSLEARQQFLATHLSF